MALGLRLGLGLSRQRQAAGGGGGVTLPSGYTALLDAESMSAGAWADLANPGSAGATWQQTGANLTVEAASGPGSRKWIKNPNTSYADAVHLRGKTIDDMFNATSGMMGLVFKCAASEYFFYDVTNEVFYMLTGATNTLAAFINAGGATATSFTPGGWTALVWRWDGTKSYIKTSDMGAWAEGADGDISLVNGDLYINGNGIFSLDCGLSLFVSYDTQSEASGDALLDYLTGLLS